MTANSEAVIGDALRSCEPWVDVVVVVNTGITDGTLDVAHAVAGDKLRVFTKPWNGDYGHMRNCALDFAAKTGCHWAVMLDTDERLEWAVAVEWEQPILDAILGSDSSVLCCWHKDGVYNKERWFRLPKQGRYTGPIHERWDPDEGATVGLEPCLVFDELPRDPDDLRHKWARDRDVLTAYVAEHPDETRWRYYLGDSLEKLGDADAAKPHWVHVLQECEDEPGLRAWTGFRLADLLMREDRPQQARAAALMGMEGQPIPELDWVAGWASLALGDPDTALTWATRAAALGHRGDGHSLFPPGAFRFLPAWHEAPYELMAAAFREAGRDEEAAQADEVAAKMKAQREPAPD